MKKIKIIIVIVILIIISPYFIARIPIQHIRMDISTENGEMEPVNYETKQLYIQESDEHGTWTVLGKDGVVFNNNTIKEHIYIVGNFPAKMNHDLFINTFVVNGRYLGKKSLGSNGYVEGCFEVDTWGVLGEVKRFRTDSYSKSSLTIFDYISEEKISHLTLESLKDVEE